MCKRQIPEWAKCRDLSPGLPTSGAPTRTSAPSGAPWALSPYAPEAPGAAPSPPRGAGLPLVPVGRGVCGRPGVGGF